jgi:hypothetical protein
MRLFHFSDDSGIEVFVPRPVRVPAQRAEGRDWLNGPLVWAIDELYQPMYLFPRDCPRILLWPTPETRPEDKETWWRGSSAKVIAYIETEWRARLDEALLWRYEFSAHDFEDLGDAGMWVSRNKVRPINTESVGDLPTCLSGLSVELRSLESLAPLKDVWKTSLHASGIRLRNARDWPGNGP